MIECDLSLYLCLYFQLVERKLSTLKMWLSSVNLTGRLRPWISNISTDLLSSLCLHSRAFHLVMTRSRQGLDVFCEELQWCTTLFFLLSSLDFFFKSFFCVVEVGGHQKANNRKQKWISSVFNAYQKKKKNLWILKTWKCLEVFFCNGKWKSCVLKR